MSQHKRNVENMHKAVREKRDATAKHVIEIIDDLFIRKEEISFSSISKITNVSKAWLYRHAGLRKKIEELRLQQSTSITELTHNSHVTLVKTLKNRVKKLEIENGELRAQLEIVYGKLHTSKK